MKICFKSDYLYFKSANSSNKVSKKVHFIFRFFDKEEYIVTKDNYKKGNNQLFGEGELK